MDRGGLAPRLRACGATERGELVPGRRLDEGPDVETMRLEEVAMRHTRGQKRAECTPETLQRHCVSVVVLRCVSRPAMPVTKILHGVDHQDQPSYTVAATWPLPCQ